MALALLSSHSLFDGFPFQRLPIIVALSSGYGCCSPKRQKLLAGTLSQIEGQRLAPIKRYLLVIDLKVLYNPGYKEIEGLFNQVSRALFQIGTKVSC